MCKWRCGMCIVADTERCVFLPCSSCHTRWYTVEDEIQGLVHIFTHLFLDLSKFFMFLQAFIVTPLNRMSHEYNP